MDLVAVDFEKLFEIVPTPLMILDSRLHFVAANDCYCAVTASRREDLLGRYVFDAFPEIGERLATVRKAFERALAGERNTLDRIVFAIERPHGREDSWWDAEQLPLHDAAGRVVGVMQHTRDVTAEVSAERMRAVISAEYDHRVRNILTKISAIARRTARASNSLRSFVDAFDPRIAAMARAHQLLVHGGWERLSLAELIAGELAPYVERVGGQVSTSGPDVTLSSRVAQALGMALHELVTNAVKHGALSQLDGRLAVDWSIGTSGALQLSWVESGLTGIATPAGAGFGSSIIDHILPAETQGKVERRFLPHGMTCIIAIPAPERG